jgi:hypothetical protein
VLNRIFSPGQADRAGAGNFQYFVILQHIQHGIDVVFPAGEAENKGLFVHVYNFGVEQFCQIAELNPVFRRDVPDFDQGQIVADEGFVVENDDFDDID